MKKLLYTSLSICLLYVAACTGRESNKQDQTVEEEKVQGNSALNDTDMDFIIHAGHGNAAEISEGKLAASQGFSSKVKEMGTMMVKDHSAALSELTMICKALNVPVAESGNEKQKNAEQRLAQFSGVSFDKKYIESQVDEHEETVKLFENEIESGVNPELKAYAGKYLPTIKHHLEMAKAMKEGVK